MSAAALYGLRLKQQNTGVSGKEIIDVLRQQFAILCAECESHCEMQKTTTHIKHERDKHGKAQKILE